MEAKTKGLIEGMTVSVDISTGEDDIEHRLFGVVSEVTESSNPKDKGHAVLLVQNPEFSHASEMFTREEFLAGCRLLLGEYGGPSIGFDTHNLSNIDKGLFVVFAQYDAPCGTETLGRGHSPEQALTDYARNLSQKKVVPGVWNVDSALNHAQVAASRMCGDKVTGPVAEYHRQLVKSIEVFTSACKRLGFLKKPTAKSPKKSPAVITGKNRNVNH